MWSKLKTDPCALLKHRVYRYSQDNLRELLHNGTKQHFSYLCTDIKHFVMTNYGVKCEIVLCAACPRGRYGAHCQSFCTCAEGGMCDPVNGSCTVDVGWAGPGNTVKKVNKYTDSPFCSLNQSSFSKQDLTIMTCIQTQPEIK